MATNTGNVWRIYNNLNRHRVCQQEIRRLQVVHFDLDADLSRERFNSVDQAKTAAWDEIERRGDVMTRRLDADRALIKQALRTYFGGAPVSVFVDRRRGGMHCRHRALGATALCAGERCRESLSRVSAPPGSTALCRLSGSRPSVSNHSDQARMLGIAEAALRACPP
jgi:hypothetical protein